MKSVFIEKSLGMDIREDCVALTLMGKRLRVVEVLAGDLIKLKPLTGQDEKAEKHFRDAMRRMITALGEESPQSVSVMNNLALLLENQGLYDEAEPLFKLSLIHI